MKRRAWISIWLCAAAIGIIPYVLIIERDAQVVAYCGSMVTNALRDLLGCSVMGTPDAVRIFAGRISVKDVGAADEHGRWSWHADYLHVYISPIASLFARHPVGTVTLSGVKVFSRAEGSHLAIQDHLARCFQAAAAPALLDVTRLSIADSNLEFVWPRCTMRGAVKAIIPMSARGALQVWWRGLHVGLDRTVLLEHGSGSAAYNARNDDARFTMTCDMPQQDADCRHWTCAGSWHAGKGIVQGGPAHGDARIMVQADMVRGEVASDGRAPCVVLQHLWPYGGAMRMGPLQGMVTWTSKGSLKSWGMDSIIEAHVRDARMMSYAIPDMDMKLAGLGGRPTLQAILGVGGGLAAHIDAALDGTIVQLRANLREPYALHTRMNISRASVTAKVDLIKEEVAGSYEGVGAVDVATIPLKGSFQATRHEGTVAGVSNGYRYHVRAAYENGGARYLVHGELRDGKEVVARASYHDDGRVEGSCAYRMLTRAAQTYGYTMPAAHDAMVKFAGTHTADVLEVDGHVSNMHMRIPYTYNLVNDIVGRVRYQFVDRRFDCSDITVSLHKGTIKGSRGTVVFREDGGVRFAHCPVQLHECFLSWEKDLFAVVSGAATISYYQSAPSPWHVRGSLVLDKSYLRGNIFAQEFQRHIFGVSASPFRLANDAINYDLHVMTRRPLKVKSPFLEASASLQLDCSGTLSATRIGGTVAIDQGALLFPYKPLFIQRSRITLRPDMPDDPLIELHADNSIKGYTIWLDATGSLKHPRIMFRASPDLDEEKIIGLLWGGSEQGSLYLAMSTAMMGAIEQLIFGPAEGSSKLQQMLSSLFKPLGSVRLVPGFTEQVGRGGLRGSLAVEVNDRLRGVIKQNFELPQDTMIEVEYALSDDARIRGFKDERGDVGAELEGRWKF